MNLDACNITELVTLAQTFEPEAHRGLGRTKLLQIIGEELVDLPEREINKNRKKITRYLDIYWEQVGSLVSCPAKSRDPRACFGCIDLQAANCITNNAGKFEIEEDT
jgi:hypothetical protein